MKRRFMMVLALCCVLAAGLAVWPPARAAEILEQGECGAESREDGSTNLQWTLDDEGTLTIKGTGRMADYSVTDSVHSTAPWSRPENTIKSIVVENGVTRIGDAAFFCKGSNVSLPDSLTSIGYRSFEHSGISSIVIPPQVATIEGNTFCECYNLISADIRSGLETIPYCMFSRCPNLENVSIPDGVVTIEDSAFSGCSSLITIQLPSNLQTIEDNAFSNSGFVRLELPETVTRIGSSAFKDCTTLNSINIPNGVTVIKSSTFENCAALVNIAIPEDVTSIEMYAFRGCDRLGSITIPAKTISLGNGAFANCTHLTSATILGNIGVLQKDTFLNCYSLAEIAIPASVTVIEERAIYHDSYYSTQDYLDVVSFGGTRAQWDKISVDLDYNPPLKNAVIKCTDSEYPYKLKLESITATDMQGNALEAIPTGDFIARVSVKNLVSDDAPMVMIVSYTAAGQFKGLTYLTVKVSVGGIVEVMLPVDNSDGDIAQLKAFPISTLGDLQPLGPAVSFPAQ